MNAVALICARGGSKGLPGKNIRELGGKPLIAHSVAHARSVARIRRVIVSTDDRDIAEKAEQAGAEIPFMRPAELARDDSPEWLVWRHALEFLKQDEGAYPDVLVTVPPTAPLRDPVDIENCLDEYERHRPDVVITMSEAHRNPYFNMVSPDRDGELRLAIQPEQGIVRRQDAPEVYDMTTVAYVSRPEFVLQSNSIFEGHVRGVLVPRERSVDIDNELDFKMAEFLLQLRESTS